MVLFVIGYEKQFIISLIFLSVFTKIITDKTTSNKEIKANQQNSAVTKTATNKQNVTPDAAELFHNFSTNNMLLPPAKIPRPKIDTTDRRRIEAYNQDKSNTTKEALDDIERIHHKEKKKKEQNNMEQYPPGTKMDAWVSNFFVISNYTG